MGKELRIGFAMGGGVSLGIFSGVALAQAIKLVLLDRDSSGKLTHERVLIDVFSGASAGAMSLALMLRGLLAREVTREQAALARLRQELGPDFEQFPVERQQDLVAVQVVLEIQAEVWGREIHLDRLLGEGGRSLEFEAGLLDRRAVEAIARDYLSVTATADLASSRRLLADRVLFGCTLSNLTAVLASARDEYPGKAEGFIGLNDGLRSSVHRELRVFDLNLSPVARSQRLTARDYPGRWCRYHLDEEQVGRIGDLRQNRSWAKIAATAIACGAFPGAFEPVVLDRARYEFGRLWPAPFQEAGEEHHSFTYVDGGTFNNEPIREAFRMASFMDAQRREEDPDAEFERLIVFVDPFVSDETQQFRVPVHQRWFLEKPNLFGNLDGVDLRRRTTLDRLVPHLGTLLGAVLDEARVVEADKVFQTGSRFQLRGELRTMLDGILSSRATVPMLKDTARQISRVLAQRSTESMIPPGRLTLAGELHRVLVEEGGARGLLKSLAGSTVTPEAFAEDPTAPVRERGAWLRALVFILLDLALDMEGKWEDYQLVAIAPFVDLRNLRTNTAPIEIKLPGAAFGGFAGFMSPVAGDFAEVAARYCAHEFLHVCGVIRTAPDPAHRPPVQLTGTLAERFRRDVERGVNLLSQRAAQVLKTSHLISVFPGLDGLIKSFVAGFVGRMVRTLDDDQGRSVTYEFRLRVWSEKDLEFDGRGTGNDIKAVQSGVPGIWELITFAACDASGNWTGVHVNASQELEVDEAGFASLRDRQFCRLALPGPRSCARADQLAYPMFTIELTPADRGRIFAERDWRLVSGVVPLEETVFGPLP